MLENDTSPLPNQTPVWYHPLRPAFKIKVYKGMQKPYGPKQMPYT